MDEPLMKIGEIAAFFNVSPKAVRIYEKMGILTPARIDPDSGYRYYSVGQVQTLNALLELKALGFTLKEIKKIMAGGTGGKGFLAALAKKRRMWEEAIAAAQNKIESIEKITERAEASRDTDRMKDMTDEERAWLLVKMVCVEDLRGQAVLSEALWL